MGRDAIVTCTTVCTYVYGAWSGIQLEIDCDDVGVFVARYTDNGAGKAHFATEGNLIAAAAPGRRARPMPGTAAFGDEGWHVFDGSERG